MADEKPTPHYLQGDEPAVSVMWTQALTDRGTVRWRGTQCGTLVNDKGERVGSFYRSGNGYGWSVWSTPYAGFAYPDEVEVIPCGDDDSCEFAAMHYPVTRKVQHDPS